MMMMEEEFRKRIALFLQRRIKEEGTINAMMQMQMVSCDFDKPSVVLSFPVETWELNPAGTMHGGIISTAIDIAMGCIAYVSCEATFTPTIQLSINFVKGIQQGETLYVEGICDHAGSRLVQTRAIARLANGDIVATANGSYAINK